MPHLLFTETVSPIDRMCHITHEFITAEFTITFFFAKKAMLLQRISDYQNYFICFVKAADRSKDVITSGFSTIWTAKWEIIPRFFQHFCECTELQAINSENSAIDTTYVPICFAVYFSYTVICRYCGTLYRSYWKFNNFKSVFAHSTPYFFRSFSILSGILPAKILVLRLPDVSLTGCRSVTTV